MASAKRATGAADGVSRPVLPKAVARSSCCGGALTSFVAARVVSPDAAAAGKMIFEGSGGCTGCHGADGGPGTVSMKSLSDSGDTLSDGDLYDKIANGVPGTSMAAYKSSLSEDEIWQLVTHIQDNF